MTKMVMNDEKGLNEAVKTLENNGIIVYPTETSYGLACDATKIEAIQKIYNLKSRESKKPLSIIVSKEIIENYCILDEESQKLVEKFMPGPLTLIVNKKNLPDILSKDTIAFRISSNNFASELVEKLGKPITATSANLSGEESVYEIEKIKELFNEKVDLIIDAGNLERKQSSTIYDTINKKVLRQGEIFLE